MSNLIQAGKNLRRNLKRDHWYLFAVIVLSIVFFWAGRASAVEPKPKLQDKVVVSEYDNYVRPRPASTTTTTTTTTAVPKLERKVVVQEQQAVAPVTIPGDDIWDRLAACESGGRWNYDGGSGFDGGLQFSPATWTRMHTHWGVNTGYAFAWQAPREVQIQVAIKLMQVSSGTHSQWPVCSKEIGMPNKF